MARLLMVLTTEDLKEEVETLLTAAGVDGYTEVGNAAGFGKTGARLGSSAYPGTSAIVFSILPAAVPAGLVVQLAELKRQRGDRLRVVAWDVEEVA